jgi:hypothetical protein
MKSPKFLRAELSGTVYGITGRLNYVNPTHNGTNQKDQSLLQIVGEEPRRESAADFSLLNSIDLTEICEGRPRSPASKSRNLTPKIKYCQYSINRLCIEIGNLSGGFRSHFPVAPTTFSTRPKLKDSKSETFSLRGVNYVVAEK